jgi:hypothetical protein
MHKRIKKLALQCNAWHQVYDQKRFLIDGKFDIEQFAGLMVKECVQKLIDNGYDDAAECLIKEMNNE